MNNAVFGKTMENFRARRDVKLVTNERQRKLLWSQPNFESSTIFSDKFEAIEMRKTHVLLNKPIAVGQCILDESKELMYTFWYDIIKPMYKDKAKLCYMDEDSFAIHIQTDDVFKDFDNIVYEWFDTSEIDKNLNRPITTGLNKKIIRKFKAELKGNILTEFIAIRPKVYGFKYIENDIIKEKKKCKGTAKYVVKNTINFETLKQTLFNNQTFIRKQQRFRSDKLVMNAKIVNKKALSNQDNKRLRKYYGITTYPIGTNPFKVCKDEMLISLKNKFNNDMIKLSDMDKHNELKNISFLCIIRRLSEST